MQNVLKTILAVLFVFVCPMISAQAQASEETPEAVAQQYIEATKAGDWAKAASLMHPDALSGLKNLFGLIVEADKSGKAVKELLGLTAAEYQKADGAIVFERVMQFMTASVPQFKELLSNSTSTILGQVAEGSDTVHIVYRMQMKLAGADSNAVDLMTMKRSGNTWRAELKGDFDKMVSSILSTLQDQQEPAKPAPKAGTKRAPRKK